jgi:cbb3-type cytochrome oxidase maturation protein
VSVIVLLIAAGAGVAGTFLGAFFWAAQSGQFDDVETPAVRVLGDDSLTSIPTHLEDAQHS